MTLPGKEKVRLLLRWELWLIFGLAIALYYPSLNYGFVNWDDDLYITANPLVHALTWDRIGKIFTSLIFANYQPVTLLSYALQYSIFGENASGYHWISVLIHACNGLLVVAFLGSLGYSRLTALLTGLVFLMHPLQVESVTWVSSQKTLISGFFSLLTLMAYNTYLLRPSRLLYGLSLLTYIFALFSKPTALTLPILLWWMSRLRTSEEPRHSVSRLIPFAVPALIEFALVLLAHRGEKAIAPISGGSLWSHSVVPFWTLFIYAKKTFFPYDLIPRYSVLKEVAWLNLTYLLPAFVIILVVVLASRLRRRYPRESFVMGFYWVLLLPTLNILPLAAPIADRYMYLPLIGPMCMVCLLIDRSYQRAKSLIRYGVVCPAAAVVFLGLFLATRSQMQPWRTSESLWRFVIDKVPNHAVAHIKLGEVYYERGELDRAIAWLQRGINLGPNNPLFGKNLVAMYIDKGNLEAARQSAMTLLKERPRDGRFHAQLGIIEALEGRTEKADSYFRRATKLNPRDAFSWYQRGRFFLGRSKHLAEAYQCFLKALELDPYDPHIHVAIGDCLARAGNYKKGIEALRYALTLDSRSATAWFNLARLLQLEGQEEAAETAYANARRINPQLSDLKDTPATLDSDYSS